MKKSLEEVEMEINKILIENDCRIIALYNYEQEQDDACLIRQDGCKITEQLNLER